MDSDNPLHANARSPAILQASLQAGIQTATDYPNIHRQFIIGGASIYKEALQLPSSPSRTSVDRILLTRVLSPSFEDCDVFMPEFRDLKSEKGSLLWERAEHNELEEWVGGEVPSGVQEENGVKYEFQMWTRAINEN